MTKNNLIIPLVIIAIAAAISVSNSPILNFNTIEGEWDISEQVKANNYEIYLAEEHDFDYSAPILQDMAKDIKESTSDADEAIKETAKTVAQHVKYSGSISIPYCYDETASLVAETRTGDCVSMSRLATALLRAQGIPARTMGGCLSFTKRCGILFATVPFEEAKTVPMVEGDFKKRGFLHEWVEVWSPNKGWMILEATAGQIYPLDCNTYLEFGYDKDEYTRCVINSQEFWQQCAGE